MPDFPNAVPGPIAVQPMLSTTPLGYIISLTNAIGGGTAVWPTANLAMYFPFIVTSQITAYSMMFQVGTQSGNCDVGIYTEQGVRLVSSGSTAVGATGIQVVDITDTVLTPALYFMAMNVDNITASFIRYSSPTGNIKQTCGVQEQAVGAVTLPDPATFANPANAYTPVLAIATNSAA